MRAPLVLCRRGCEQPYESLTISYRCSRASASVSAKYEGSSRSAQIWSSAAERFAGKIALSRGISIPLETLYSASDLRAASDEMVF